MKNTIGEVFYQWPFNRFTICNNMIQIIGLEFYRGLLDVINNCLCRSKLERLMRDLFEGQIAIIEDRITVLVLLCRAYCHTIKLAPCLYEKIEAFKCLNLVVFSTFKVCPCHFKTLVTNKLIRVILPPQKH